jgi:hypothetical protein
MRVKVMLAIMTGYVAFILLGFAILHHFNESSLIFDQINLLSIIYVLVLALIILRRGVLRYELLVFAVISTLALGQTFTNVILNIDRSRSFFVLSWIRYHEIDYKVDKFDVTKVRSDEKESQGAINNRIEEQITRGLVIQSKEKIELTTMGKIIVSISDQLAKIFSLNGWWTNNH